MTAVVILMLAAAAGFGVSRATRMPLIPLLVVAGFAVARGGLSLTADALEDALSLGLTFLIFSMGVELNPARFRRFRAAVMWTGALQFLVVGACGFALAVWLGFGSLPALYLAISVTTSSTLVVIRQLQRQTGAFGTYGKLVTGVLLVQDLALIMVLVVISRLPEGPKAIASGMGVVAGMAGAAFAIQRWVTPILAPRFRPGEETLLLSILAVLFLFAGAARAGGLPLVTGAFFAGFSLSAFPVSGVVRSVLGSLNTWFLALFFTALGARLEIPGLSTLAKAIAFALLVLAVTPPLVAAVAEWKGGLSSRNAIISGLFLAQTSEMGVVLGLYGVHLEAVPGEVLSIVALTAVITMTLTPLLAKDSVARRLLPLHPLRRRLPTASELEGHTLVLGAGTAGIWLVKRLASHGHRVVVVDDDPVVIEELREIEIPCLRGDAADEKTLARAGADRARLVLVSLPHPEEAAKVLQFVPPGVPVHVRVFERADAEAIEREGGIPVLNSIAAADAFMEWFGDGKGASPVKQSAAGPGPGCR